MAIDLKKLSQSQLNDLIVRAERRKEEIAVEGVQKVRDRIHKLLADEGFTFEDVFGSKRGRGKAKGSKVKPKYRNPADPSQTWAGRGKRPRWFTEALAAGKKEKDLLIA
ncbi:MAG TPA: H-NS histone family protein [Pseudomonadota bacterium]|nr:H-NS histone family protein [Xanthomonadales bacterium]HQW80317.1 H-NS histone family protein [Pseudomonadota bacterium]